MKESLLFNEAFGIANYNPELAIKLYDQELKNNPESFIALNNRGCCKMEVARKNKDLKLLEDAKSDFNTAIQYCKKITKEAYPGATDNLLIIERIRAEIEKKQS